MIGLQSPNQLIDKVNNEQFLSGDGTLSVTDVRSNKKTPFAQSEDQEDELLSVVPFRK
jgi:hypothetical protein